jgi:hypothetical protein
VNGLAATPDHDQIAKERAHEPFILNTSTDVKLRVVEGFSGFSVN